VNVTIAACAGVAAEAVGMTIGVQAVCI